MISIMRRFLCSFDNFEADAYDFDVIIVGSGVAGLYAALHVDPALQVALVTKANIDESNSYLAQGGIAAVMTADDNYVNHIDDTLKAGAGLCNVEAVKVLVEEGPDKFPHAYRYADPVRRQSGGRFADYT